MNKQKAKAALEEKLATLEKRLAGVTKDITKTLSSDFAEQATERENDDVLEEIARESQVSIAKIKSALQRLDEDTYGYCVKCGNEIQEGRLEAIPEATHCVKCADKAA